MMKKVLLTALTMVMFASASMAQGPHNVIFFSEGGDLFTLFINGVQQNDMPAANVKASDLKGTGYQLRVVFENAVPGEFSKNQPLPEGSTEMTFALRKNNKGSWVARFVSEAPYPAKTVEKEIVVRSESVPASQPARQPVSDPRQQPAGVQKQEVITTTTTTTMDAKDIPAGTVGISIKTGEEDFGINISVDDRLSNQTTTTVVTTQTVTNDTDYEVVETREIVTAQPKKAGDCDNPMTDSEFANAKSSISSKSFEDSKLSIAKQITRGNCLTSTQVRDIMSLFSFEETRLDFAKFAYNYTYDKRNYYLINDAFQFEMTIEELDEFLNQQ